MDNSLQDKWSRTYRRVQFVAYNSLHGQTVARTNRCRQYVAIVHSRKTTRDDDSFWMKFENWIENDSRIHKIHEGFHYHIRRIFLWKSFRFSQRNYSLGRTANVVESFYSKYIFLLWNKSKSKNQLICLLSLNQESRKYLLIIFWNEIR